MSEILERTVAPMLFNNRINKLYVINKDKIKNNELKEKIKLIEDTNKVVYIIDFSYNFGIPVIGTIILDKSTLRTIVDLGCFPVADIALERCFTESWQNVNVMTFDHDTLTIPYRSEPAGNFVDKFMSGYGKISFLPEDIFNKMVVVDDFNCNCYIDEHHNNEEILEYYKDLIKRQNLQIYWREDGLITEMSSVQLVASNLCLRCPTFFDLTKFQNIDWNNLIVQIEGRIMTVNELTSTEMNADKIVEFMINSKVENDEQSLLCKMMYRD